MVLSKNEIGKKIKYARYKKGQSLGKRYTQEEMANDIGISRSYLGDIEAGRKYPNYVLLSKIADVCGVPLNYFEDENDKKDNDLVFADTPEKYLTVTSDLIKIPVLGVIRAGEPIYVQQNIIGYEYLPEDMVQGGEYFGLKVTGDSMNLSHILDGQIVIIRKQEEVENGEIAAVIVNGEEATIKRIYCTDTTITLMPHSSNSEHQPRMIDTTKVDVRILGKAVKVVIAL